MESLGKAIEEMVTFAVIGMIACFAMACALAVCALVTPFALFFHTWAYYPLALVVGFVIGVVFGVYFVFGRRY